MSTEPADRTRASWGRGELTVAQQRASRRPEVHPRHDEVRPLLLDVPAAHGQRSNDRYRLGDHYTLFADGRVIWVKPERSYTVNDWWTDEQGEVWAIDDGALDGVLQGLKDSMRGIDGFIADLTAIRHPEPEPDTDTDTDAWWETP